MPKDEVDPDDPMELVGVEFASRDDAHLCEMALCFAEEFVREGWGAEEILKMFRNPFYRGPHLAWKQKGDAFILEMIEKAVKTWRPCEERTT
ncbi:MAG: hypothetical protein HY593_02035 [Candidatus Omnitrophica bacterium]|nr:hypothetical protein [Candidatus Omnitrophota bacterium]